MSKSMLAFLLGGGPASSCPRLPSQWALLEPSKMCHNCSISEWNLPRTPPPGNPLCGACDRRVWLIGVTVPPAAALPPPTPGLATPPLRWEFSAPRVPPTAPSLGEGPCGGVTRRCSASWGFCGAQAGKSDTELSEQSENQHQGMQPGDRGAQHLGGSTS